MQKEDLHMQETKLNNISLSEKLKKMSKNKKIVRHDKSTFKDSTAQKLLQEKNHKIIPFPSNYPKTKSIAPVAILRSALFGIVKRGARKKFNQDPISMKGEKMASYGQCVIRYTGYQLDQADLDTWMALLDILKTQGFGATVSVTPYEILKLIGKTTDTRTYQWLHASIRRLLSGTVEIEEKNAIYIGHLVDTFVFDKKENKYLLKVNSSLSELFCKSYYSALEREIRQKLKGDLTKWLYGYCCSHDTSAQAHCISIEKLKKLCGSEAPMRNFKVALKKSMHQLELINFIRSEIKSEKFYFVKNKKCKLS